MLTASVRVVLTISNSSAVVAVSFACCMLKLRSVATSFWLFQSALHIKGFCVVPASSSAC